VAATVPSFLICKTPGVPALVSPAENAFKLAPQVH
jgi:hypothetical protein